MKSAGAPPESPNPETTIPLQGAENRKTFDYMLGAQRVNQTSPYGTQSWQATPIFDQSGYDKAVKAWGGSPGTPGSQGTWVPGRPGDSRPDINGNMVNDPGTEGQWSGGGGTPGTPGNGAAPTRDQFTTNQWNYSQQFSPGQQKLFDANQASQLQQSQLLAQLTGRVGDATKNPLNFSGAPSLVGSIRPQDITGNIGYNPQFQDVSGGVKAYSDRLGGMDPYQFYQKGADAAYGQATRYLDPQVKQQESALQARLADQGFVPGTPGYDQAMRNFSDTNNRQYAQARDSAITTGMQGGDTAYDNQTGSTQAAIASLLQGGQFRNSMEQQKFGNALTGANFANQAAQQRFQNDQAGGVFQNQARNQAIAEMLQQRQYPLNELNAMRSGTQVQLPNNPAQYATPNLQPTDIMGAYQQNYQNQLGGYNAQVGSANAGNNGLMGLVGMGMNALAPGAGSLFSGLASRGGGGFNGFQPMSGFGPGAGP